MLMDTKRLEAFSDGVMAILITIMVLGVPLPETLAWPELLYFIRTLGVYLVSFLVVGVQWMRHHYLFEHCRQITGKTMWSNLLYLFFLSLMPLFSKWMIMNPQKVIPALGYDLVFFMLSLSFHSLQNCVLGTNGKMLMDIMRKRQRRSTDGLFISLILAGAVGIVVLSLVLPAVSIIFFLAVPVVCSLRFARTPDEMSTGFPARGQLVRPQA